MRDVGTATARFGERRRVTYELDGAGGATVTNHGGGYRWERGPRPRNGAWWNRVSPRPVGATRQAAQLIAHPDTRGDDLAALLRGALAEPWPSLLRRAERVAREELGVTADRIRAMRDLVTAIMAVSELLPHRVVLVVDDPAAVAAAYAADAELAGTHVEAVGYRYSAGVQRAAGERVVMSTELPRERLVTAWLEVDREARPGQHVVVEPVARVGAR